jgi:RND family efflux transporter MFP subunit
MQSSSGNESLSLPSDPSSSSSSPRRRWFLLLFLLAVGGLVWAGVGPRLARRKALDAHQAEASGPPRVAVGLVRKGDSNPALVLPGTALPALSTVVYARLDGFVEQLLVDLGDEVKEGQLLAVLHAPELEAELARANARFGEVERNVTLSKTSAERHARLAGAGISSLEAADEARARANSAEAALDSGNAEVKRLSALYAYRRVLAPFAGTITRRGVDKGALVKSASTALYEIAQTRTLKIFVDVPQTLAADIHPGVTAQIFTPEAPERMHPGKVVRTSRALDPSTRTLRTEIHLPGQGSDGKGNGLLAGAFVRVRLAINRNTPPLLMSATALVVGKEGPRVLLLGPGNKLQARPVVIGRDFGVDLEVMDGVAAGDRVVLNPPDDLQAGTTVVTVAEAHRAP